MSRLNHELTQAATVELAPLDTGSPRHTPTRRFLPCYDFASKGVSPHTARGITREASRAVGSVQEN